MVLKLNKLFYYAVAVAAASAAGLTGCASDYSAAAAAGAPEQSSIVVDAVPAAEEAGLYTAAANGFFQQQGLHVQIKPIIGGESGIPDLQSGKAQIVAGNYVSFVLAQMAGQYGGKPANFRIISAGAQLQPGSEALYVMPNSSVKSVADLVQDDAKVGLNTYNDVGQVLLGSLLTQIGFSLNDIRQVVPTGGFSALMTMLKNGEVDAAWLPQPFGTMAQQQFGAVELTDFDQGALQNFPFTGYIGDESWVRSHPGTVAAFNRALVQGQQLADTDRAAAEKAMQRYAKLPPIIADTMPYDSYPLTTAGPMMQRVSNAMFEFGLEGNRKKPYQMTNMIQQTPGVAGSLPG
jgi:NitT/TauT family transport system substrate-binding protein